MHLIKRIDGAEQPYWPLGPFKVRLPFVHYRWEIAEMLQALIMFVVFQAGGDVPTRDSATLLKGLYVLRPLLPCGIARDQAGADF